MLLCQYVGMSSCRDVDNSRYSRNSRNSWSLSRPPPLGGGLGWGCPYSRPPSGERWGVGL